METVENLFLQSAIKRLSYYKELGDKTFAQLQAADFHFKPNDDNNSIAVIIQHLNGNMRSRFTDFLTSDGEKEWRNRDAEFEVHNHTKEGLLQLWNEGWNCCLQAIGALTAADLLRTIYIRTEPLLVIDAINRQLAHYPYHVGQIVYIARIIKNSNWSSLSIPRGQSDVFNQSMKTRH